MDTEGSSPFPLALTFDDILLLPGYSDFKRDDIDLSTKLSSTITLQIPFISSPMDTVTEDRMALALGKLGGLGIIHRNLSIEAQARMVEKVSSKKVLIGAALSAGAELEKRAQSLVKANVNVIVVDSAHGYTSHIVEGVAYLKKKYPKIHVMAGNIATSDGARALIAAGADSLRIGMGPGAICTTRVVSGMGVPQVTALLDVVKYAKTKKVPVIADGGIRYSGDIVKAFALGSTAVMMGSFFASCTESPGKIVKLTREHVPARFLSVFNGKRKVVAFKEYRGMGSMEAMQKGARVKAGEEFHGKSYKDKVLVAEGVSGLVPIKAHVKDAVDQALGGVKSGMYYVGAKNMADLQRKAKFIRITQASLIENHPHDILVVNPGENYK